MVEVTEREAALLREVESGLAKALDAIDALTGLQVPLSTSLLHFADTVEWQLTWKDDWVRY